ncbi:hypothetical protein ACQ4WY_25255 [Janthinobacterium sp. LB2P49]
MAWYGAGHGSSDATYDRRKLLDKAAFLEFTVEVVRRLEGQQDFSIQPRHWVVERTSAWLKRSRKLARDYKQRIDVSKNMIYMGSLLLRRLNFRWITKPSLLRKMTKTLEKQSDIVNPTHKTLSNYNQKMCFVLIYQ